MEDGKLTQKSIPMEELMALLSVQMEKGGSARLTVTGYSMMPLLYNLRDSVTLVPADGKEKKGDIILYKRENGAYVLHRIIDIVEGGYICCGDNQYMREQVAFQQILARVTAFTRKGKRIPVENKAYQRYVTAWIFFFPLRGMYIPVRRCLGRLIRKFKTK